MIILAATVIISLTGNSVIDRANEAVDKTNEANVQQLASTLWAEAYLDGVRDKDGFKEAVKDGLEKSGINPEEYAIIATTSGVTVSKGWAKDGFTVVKGEQVLEIGDIVHYDETAGGTIEFGEDNPDSDDVKWKVLGADEEGNLLLMSTVNLVESHRLGHEDSMTDFAVKLAESQNDWLNGAMELDGLCEPYGYGKGVVGKARSITIDDINSVTGYNKTTYGKDELYQYGNEVTYSYNGTTKPAYTSTIESGTITTEHSKGFYYYDGEEFKVANDLTTKDTGIIAKVKNNACAYAATTLATKNPKVHTMIFGNNDVKYWLASSYIYSKTDLVYFLIGHINSGSVNGVSICDSTGGASYFDRGVRAVVTLSSDIVFTGNSTDGWSY